MFKFKEPITLAWLADKLNLVYKGDGSFSLIGVASSDKPSPNALLFTKADDLKITDTVLVAYESNVNSKVLVSANPRFDFIRALEVINSEVGFRTDESTPLIHPSVRLGHNVVIENGVSIGKGTVIEHNAVIMRGTHIGDNCLIRANSSIGGDGFGYERETSGQPIKFIHLGGVIIGNNVEVGSNTCIAKGTLGNTIVEDNVKIDNLVHIAHNCILREGAFIIACTILCGGVEVGKNAWVAPNATVTQKAKVGERAVIGLGAVVTKSVEADKVVAGNPAKVLIRRN